MSKEIMAKCLEEARDLLNRGTVGLDVLPFTACAIIAVALYEERMRVQRDNSRIVFWPRPADPLPSEGDPLPRWEPITGS